LDQLLYVTTQQPASYLGNVDKFCLLWKRVAR